MAEGHHGSGAMVAMLAVPPSLRWPRAWIRDGLGTRAAWALRCEHVSLATGGWGSLCCHHPWSHVQAALSVECVLERPCPWADGRHLGKWSKTRRWHVVASLGPAVPLAPCGILCCLRHGHRCPTLAGKASARWCRPLPCPAAPPPACGDECFLSLPGQLVEFLKKSETKGPLSCDTVLKIFYQTCRAVQHMHRQKPPITHRDLKVLPPTLTPCPG